MTSQRRGRRSDTRTRRTSVPHRHPGAACYRGLAGRDLPPASPVRCPAVCGRRRLPGDLRLPDHRPPPAATRRPRGRTWPASGAGGSGGCCPPRCWCSRVSWWRPGSVLPETQWESPPAQTRAAALYVVNWQLAVTRSTTSPPRTGPPVQHYWSLSVEEQFYFVWPLLLGARRARGPAAPVARGGPRLAAGTGAVVVLSLALVDPPATDPAAAYFVTPTRMWELGAGGLLALPGPGLRAGRPRAGPLRAWAAGRASPIAAPPTPARRRSRAGGPRCRCVAALRSCPPAAPERCTPGRAAGGRPVQWLGDVSYSVYLWHWPLIVIVPVRRHVGHASAVDRSAILVVTLVLGGPDQDLRRGPFRLPLRAGPGEHLRRRGGRHGGGRGRRQGCCSPGPRLRTSCEPELARALAGGDPCFGRRPWTPAAVPPGATMRRCPRPRCAAKDKSDAYADVSGGRDCWSSTPRFPVLTCEFGKRGRTSRSPSSATPTPASGCPPSSRSPRSATGGSRPTWPRGARCPTCRRPSTPRPTRGPAGPGSGTTARRSQRARPRGADQPHLGAAVGADLRRQPGGVRAGYERVLRTRAPACAVLVLHDTPAPGCSDPRLRRRARRRLRCLHGTRAEWLPDGAGGGGGRRRSTTAGSAPSTSPTTSAVRDLPRGHRRGDHLLRRLAPDRDLRAHPGAVPRASLPSGSCGTLRGDASEPRDTGRRLDTSTRKERRHDPRPRSPRQRGVRRRAVTSTTSSPRSSSRPSPSTASRSSWSTTGPSTGRRDPRGVGRAAPRAGQRRHPGQRRPGRRAQPRARSTRAGVGGVPRPRRRGRRRTTSRRRPFLPEHPTVDLVATNRLDLGRGDRRRSTDTHPLRDMFRGDRLVDLDEDGHHFHGQRSRGVLPARSDPRAGWTLRRPHPAGLRGRPLQLALPAPSDRADGGFLSRRSTTTASAPTAAPRCRLAAHPGRYTDDARARLPRRRAPGPGAARRGAGLAAAAS